ncbi:MAG TPA: ATP-binding cassette domain-containing protein [Saprospiraceae bacterium]|nr:ATP-binding cassette domain-containing protein [Saprospiraceae bacterium]
MISIAVNRVIKSKNDTFKLSCNFNIESGSFVSVFGPSGAGKTSLIRIIAGLDKIDDGFINIDNTIWVNTQEKINLKPQQRQVGMVFQNSALFPNMSTQQNLEYALNKGQSYQIINELIEILELKDIINKKPSQLSGGQQQKVALARALVQKPKILLLDEPLSALDDDMRFKLQDYILRIHKKYNLTTFLIRHNIAEVFKMSDTVIKLNNGQILKQGNPNEVLLDSKLSGKYKSIGHILKIKKADIVNIVSVLTNNSIIKIVATTDEVNQLKIGDKVMVASKAFNPVLIKFEESV